MLPTISKITVLSVPYNNSHTEYQKYYQVSLKTFCQANDIEFSVQNNSFLPFLSAMLRIFRYSTKLSSIFRFLPVLRNTIDRIAKFLELKKVESNGQPDSAIGQYIVSYSDGSYKKICINSQDFGNIRGQRLLDWADVYFKTNFWPSINYPDKVYPLPNGNPYIISHLNYLKQCRSEKKEFDLCFVVRVWGGSDEVSGIEHNLRMLEAVSPESYKEATVRPQEFISNKKLIKSIAVNNADYFDNHFSPRSIGTLIC